LADSKAGEHKFQGYPRNAGAIPVPVLFFESVLPSIEDINELKMVLGIFKLIKYKRGYLRFVTLHELIQNKTITSGIKVAGNEQVSAVMNRAVDLAVEHGSLVKARLVIKGQEENVYIINHESDRTALDNILNGKVTVDNLDVVSVINDDLPAVDNIYKLYEQNIGVITPLIAEELKKAEEMYSTDWIREAFSEAIKQNIRNWKYISRILERWTEEGKTDGKTGRYSKKEKDRDRFIKGKYGHLVNR
jgi:DNA replication protein